MAAENKVFSRREFVLGTITTAIGSAGLTRYLGQRYSRDIDSKTPEAPQPVEVGIKELLDNPRNYFGRQIKTSGLARSVYSYGNIGYNDSPVSETCLVFEPDSQDIDQIVKDYEPFEQNPKGRYLLVNLTYWVNKGENFIDHGNLSNPVPVQDKEGKIIKITGRIVGYSGTENWAELEVDRRIRPTDEVGIVEASSPIPNQIVPKGTIFA